MILKKQRLFDVITNLYIGGARVGKGLQKHQEIVFSEILLRLFSGLFICLFLTISASAEKTDLAPYSFKVFFDTARLVKIDFQIDAEDWNKLRLQHRSLVKTLRTDIPPSEQKKPFSYFSANMVIDGTDVGKVAIRKKGFVGSLDQDRPSFKVKIDKYDKNKMFAGVDTLTLNNNKQDGSRIHQLIGYQLFRAAGLPASHCNLALISVNSKSLGVYSNVESLDKRMFFRASSSAKGTLYEGTICDFQLESIIRFERKFGAEEAISNIEKACVALTSNDESLLSNLGRYLNMDHFYRYWAMEVLIGHWDGYVSNKNNYFVYFDKESNQLFFLPWGMDQLATDRNMSWQRGFVPPKSVKADAAIPRRLYKNLEAKKQYFTVIQWLLTEVWAEDKLIKQIDDLQTLIIPYRVQKDSWVLLDRAFSFKKFISNRRVDILKEIDGGFPQWTLSPREIFGLYISKIGDCKATFSIQMGQKSMSFRQFAEVKGEANVWLKVGEDSFPFDTPVVQLKRNGRDSVTLRLECPWSNENEPKRVEVTFPRPRRSSQKAEWSYRIDIFASPAQGQLVASNSKQPIGSLGGKVVLTQFGFKPSDKIEGRLESEVFKLHP